MDMDKKKNEDGQDKSVWKGYYVFLLWGVLLIIIVQLISNDIGFLDWFHSLFLPK